MKKGAGFSRQKSSNSIICLLKNLLPEKANKIAARSDSLPHTHAWVIDSYFPEIQIYADITPCNVNINKMNLILMA